MSLLDLLPLNENEIELVTTVVRQWCEDHRVLIESGRGRVAMTTAVGLVISGERSPEALSEALGRCMRIEQYNRPLD
ncbi:hypothetical protein N2599_13870 [Rhizobium sullae]|uniref:Uncharacterized protein n=1 Tax=Rhizobium sullae TaxID=50338 RepID=A0A2N0D668_RHISU|nr:hypothetical protein [Rhizobium sullae]PKA41594.1 hypothetical protein CWR43_19690 [Rhizobium sullae]UWU13232.1 hypothetical protein N2599_13870 [Rhizobium sullae]